MPLLLIKGDNGPEYHAYAKIRVDQSQIQKSLVNALQKANPKANINKINQIVINTVQSITVGK